VIETAKLSFALTADRAGSPETVIDGLSPNDRLLTIFHMDTGPIGAQVTVYSEAVWRFFQSNANPSPLFADERSLCLFVYYKTRFSSAYSPRTCSTNSTGAAPRLRQNQPWEPSNAAVSSPESAASALPFR
jgi:hypothetical protein